MTPAAQALGDSLRAAARAGDTATVIALWAQADVEHRASLAYYLPRAAVLADELREGELTAALAAALSEPDYDSDLVGGEESAAAECLRNFFSGELRRFRDEDPISEYAKAWQYLRRMQYLAGLEPERRSVDKEAFTGRNHRPHWGPVRLAVANRLGDLVHYGTGGDNRCHEPWHTS